MTADQPLSLHDIITRAAPMAQDAGVSRVLPELEALRQSVPDAHMPPARAFDTLTAAALSAHPPRVPRSTDLTVFDPGMVSCGGHHVQFNRFLIDALTARGTSFSILSGNSACTAQFGLSDHFHDVFTLNPYEFDHLVTDLTDALAMNLLFVLELATARLHPPRVWLCHSLRITNCLAVMALARQHHAPLVGVVVEFDHLAPDHEHARVADDVYRVMFDLTRDRSDAVQLTCETDNGQSYMNAIAAERHTDVRLGCAHYLPAIWNARQYRQPAPRAPAPCFGFVGGTRESRGADILPLAIVESCARHPEITWRVQFDRTYLTGQMPTDVVQAWDGLIFSGRLTVLGQGLDSADYYAHLNALDILVLPYAERYKHSGSGVFHEALSFAKPVLVMAGSTMAHDLDRLGIAGPRIATYSADDVVDAITETLSDTAALGHMQRQFADGADRFNTDLDAFLDAFGPTTTTQAAQ
ncbi:MAG: glycosyltransferase [Ruegeria sp.]